MHRSIRAMVRFFAFLEFAAVASAWLSCAAPASPPELEVRLPALPEAWTAALGGAEWSLRWKNGDGEPCRRDGVHSGVQVELEADVSSAVLAYPYWPHLGIGPGVVRPAGAVHPFDEDDGVLLVDWRGGPPAVFFHELSGAGGETRTLPQRFDWPRFRELLYGDLLAAEVGADPWVVDWRAVAEKTRASGFDRRRLVPRPTEFIEFIVPADGPWVASSPFAPSPTWAAGERVTIQASGEAAAFLSASGVLRCSKDVVAWFPTPLSEPVSSGRLPIQNHEVFHAVPHPSRRPSVRRIFHRRFLLRFGNRLVRAQGRHG